MIDTATGASVPIVTKDWSIDILNFRPGENPVCMLGHFEVGPYFSQSLQVSWLRSGRREYLHIMIQSAGGQNWSVGVCLQAVDHALMVSGHILDHLLCVLVPKEHITTITATGHILALKTKEINTFHCREDKFEGDEPLGSSTANELKIHE